MVMQNILGGVLGQLGGNMLAPKPLRTSQAPFKRHMVVTDGLPAAVFGTAALVDAILIAGAVGAWTLVWQTIVPAQQQIRWGFGSPATPQNQGYMWFYSLDAGVDYSVGLVRLVQCSARGLRPKTALEVDDTALHSAVAAPTVATAPLINKNEMIALPEKRELPKVGEDSLMQIWYYLLDPNAGAAGVTNFSIPVTVYQ